MNHSLRIRKMLAYILMFSMTVSGFTFSSPTKVSAASKKYVKSLKVSQKKKTLNAGTKATIKATVSAKGSVKKNVTAKISDKKAASVKVGKPNKKGVSIITITAHQVTKTTKANIKITTVGKNAKKKKLTKSVMLTVSPAEETPANPTKVPLVTEVLPESIMATAEFATIDVGKTTVISSVISPANATNKSVTYISGNPQVATVNKEGVVLGVSAGTAEITVMTSNGKTAKVNINVAEVIKFPESVTVTAESTTIDVGNTTIIKSEVSPADAADKSVTYTSDNPQVATVNKEGIVLGVSEGTVEITVTTSNGKSAKVNIKVVEVSVTGVTVESENTEITVTGTTTLSAKVSPANATIQKLTWESSDTNIATVDKDGVVKGVSAGSVVIRATASNGIYGECNVTVKNEATEADGVFIEVTNPYIDKDGKVYPETALVGNDLIVRARVVKKGLPVGNTSVTLSMKKLYGNCSDAFTVRTPTEKTDDNGYANFVIGLKTDQSLNALSEKFQSYLVKAQESSSNVSQEITIKFASVRVNGISVLNGTDEDYPDIKPSTYANPLDSGIYSTWYLDNEKTEEYVTNQQNSSDLGDDNRVYFSATPMLLMPVTRETERAENWELNVTNGTSGACSIYNDDANRTTQVQVERIPAGLRYLRLRFGKIDISKYTTINIDIFGMANGESLEHIDVLEHLDDLEPLDHREVTSGQNGSDLIQIEQQWDVPSFLVVTLVSQGQVDTTSQGYILDKLEGVWASTNDERNEPEPIQGSVKWTNVSEELGYENMTWTYAEAVKYFPEDSPYLNVNYTYSYKVPGFPHTGDAIITVKDTQGNETTFLYPTINNGNNKNVLAPASYRIDAVMIANEAVNRKVGTLTTMGDIAVVDSKELGTTSLKAEVSIEGLKNNELTTGNGGVLYTSVQWVNVPNEEEISEAEDYFAIEGQEVTVTAQLYDKNGITVASPNKKITFSYEENGEKLKIDLDGNEAGGRAALVEVTNKGATDGEGIVKIRFRDITNNKQFSLIEGLTAESADKSYNVRLTFDGTNYVKAGNVYWVDLGLTFVDSAVDEDMPVRTTQFDNGLKSVEKKTRYTVSDKVGWQVGYQVVARSMKFQYDYIKRMNIYGDVLEENVDIPHKRIHEFVSVSGIKLKYELDNKNATLINENNAAKLFSTVAGDVKLIGMFDIDELNSEEVTFVYYNDRGEKVTCKNIGTGKPISIGNSALSVTTSWETSGTDVKIIAPEVISTNTSRYAYVKVTDNYGNPIEGADVKYALSGVNASPERFAGLSDKYGIVRIILPATDDISATTSTIRVTVKDSIVKNTLITYTDVADGPFKIAADETNKYAVEVGDDSRTLELYFTNNILFESFNKKQLSLVRADGTPYTIRSIEKGTTSKSVIITLDEIIEQKSAVHILRVQDYKDEQGILHVPTDIFGQIITEQDNVQYLFKPADCQQGN